MTYSGSEESLVVKVDVSKFEKIIVTVSAPANLTFSHNKI